MGQQFITRAFNHFIIEGKARATSSMLYLFYAKEGSFREILSIFQPWKKKLTDWFVPKRKRHNDIVINSSSGTGRQMSSWQQAQICEIARVLCCSSYQLVVTTALVVVVTQQMWNIMSYNNNNNSSCLSICRYKLDRMRLGYQQTYYYCLFNN